MNVNILFRSCDRVNAFSGGGRVRPFGSKQEITLKCFKFLLKSIRHYEATNQGNNNPLSLYVVDDHSSEELLVQMASMAEENDIKFKLIKTKEKGNGYSLKTCYEYCRDELDGLLFYCEDDYLMTETTVDECVDAYFRLKLISNNEVCIHPVDYPDRYHSKYTPIYPAFIFLGKNRHWRTVAHTTGTIMISKEVLVDQWDKYEKLTNYGVDPAVTEANTINLVYEKYPCFSPIPTLAHHYQFPDTLSPFLELTVFDED